MIETILKRTIGAAIFIAILIVFVPELLDGSGDIVSRDPPVIHGDLGRSRSEIARIEREAGNSMRTLTEGQRTSHLTHNDYGQPVIESTLPSPFEPADLTTAISSVVPAQPESRSAVPEIRPPDPSETTEDDDVLGDFIKSGFEGWVVQMGLFSQSVNASQLRSQLKRELQDDEVFVRKIEQAGTVYNGVFIGPYIKKDEAEAIKDKLHNKLGIEGYVRSIDSV